MSYARLGRRHQSIVSPARQIPLLGRTDCNIARVPSGLEAGRIVRLRQQTIGLLLDHGIAFATHLFQPGSV